MAHGDSETSVAALLLTIRVTAVRTAFALGIGLASLTAWIPAVAAISYVQGNTGSFAPPYTSISAAFTSPQSAGDLNVVMATFSGSGTLPQSVTDTAGNVYTLAVAPTVLPDYPSHVTYYAKNIVASPAGNTVTVTFNQPFASDLRIAEYSGIDPTNPFDGGVGASGYGEIADSGFVTATGGALLVAGAWAENALTAPGPGYTIRLPYTILEDRIAPFTGSHNASAEIGGSGAIAWVMQLAAFRAASAPDTQPPTTPTGLTATPASSTQINLSWNASTDNVAVTGYLVERCQGASCTSFSQIATPAGTTYNDTGRSPSTTYRYRVRARDAVPNYSGYSSIVNATTPAAGDTQPPTAPTNLSATPISSTQINLSWTASTDNFGVTGYLVERCQGASCTSFSQIATPTGTTYNDTGRSPSTTYRYRVRAQDAVPNFSNYSSIVNATTPAAADTQPPTAPTGLTVTAGANQNVLAWTASTDNVAVTAYLIERCSGAGCSSFTQIDTTSATSYTDATAVAAISYSYRVRARDAVPNYSGYSSIGTATPADCD